MRITAEQEKILATFECERLSSNDLNFYLIKNFLNKKGQAIVEYFQENAWQEDVNGTTAYYVIKTQDNEIVMFFSLKCGVLFDPLLDETETQQDIQRLLILLQAIENANDEEVKEQILSDIIKKYGWNNELSLKKLENI